jgi:ABC-type glycerol-3-phosphate transport system permease component
VVTGAWWKRWLCLYLPLGAIVVLTLLPFYYMAVTAVRPDREMYIPWNRPNFAPFWTFRRWSTSLSCSGRPSSPAGW